MCLSLLLAALESLWFQCAHANNQVDSSGYNLFSLLHTVALILEFLKILLRNQCIIFCAVQKYEIVHIQLPSSKLEINSLNLIYNDIFLSIHTVVILFRYF